ncbi:MAG: hypothetical protein ACJ788_27540, partial [Ktedonobacteraceae bacterium]
MQFKFLCIRTHAALSPWLVVAELASAISPTLDHPPTLQKYELHPWQERAWENRSTSGILFRSVVNSVANQECAKGTVMIDHDNLEDFRDPQIYDLQDEGYDDDYPLTEQWARLLGGPLLDLA